MMDTERSSRELQVYDLADCGSLGNQTFIPTVCVVASDRPPDSLVLGNLVEQAAKIGCHFFMTWGAAAEVLHDELDALIEGKGSEYLNIATMSHVGESIEDLAWFLVNAAVPGAPVLRCCIVAGKPLVGLERLVAEVQREISILS